MATQTDTHSTFEEETKEAWSEDKAEDYPVQSFDDTAAEEDPANSSGFIGGVADMRPKPKDNDTETTGEQPENETTSDEPEADAGTSDTVKPSAEDDDDAPDDTADVDAGLNSRIREAGLSDLSDLSVAQLDKVLAHMQRAEDRGLLRPDLEKPTVDSDPQAVEEPEEFKLDPEYQDPEVIKAFEVLDKRHRAQNQKLQAQLDELSSHARRQAQTANQNEFDSWVNSLPKEYAEFLGAGLTIELDENSDAFKARNEVALAAGAMEARIVQNGNTPPNRKAMLKRGLHAILGDKVTQIESAIEKKKGAKRRSRTTAMPTHKRERDPQKPLGDRAAHEWANQWLHNEGLAPSQDSGFPEEGI